MALLDVFVVNVAAPAIQADLDLSPGAVQWLVAAYVLPYAVLLVTGGRVGDALGRRRTLQLGLGLFTLASIGCGAAPTEATLIAARALQGAGAALMTPQVLTVIQVEFPPADRARCMAWFGVVAGVGAVAGQLVGGSLIALDVLDLGWRSVFLVNVPIGLTAIAAASRLVPESRAAEARRIDRGGVVLSAVTLLLVVLPIVQGREAGWPWWVPAMLVAAVATGALWWRHEERVTARGEAPLVDLRLLRLAGFRDGISLVTAMYCAMPCVFLVLAFYLQSGHGLSALESAAVFTPLCVSFVGASFAAPRLLAAHGPRALVAGAAYTAGAAAIVGAVVLSDPDGLPTAPLCVALFVLGFGPGMMMPSSVRAALETVPPALAGSAAGVVTTIQQVGNVLSVAIAGVIFFGVVGDAPSSADYAHGFAAALVWTVAVALVGATLALRMAGAPTRAREALAPGGRRT